MFEDILRYWLSGGVYEKRKLGVLVIGKRLLKKESWGGVRVIEILNYNFLRLKAFIENKKT